MSRTRLAAACAVLLALVIACGGGEQTAGTIPPAATADTAGSPAPTPALEAAPDFSLTTFGGDTFTLSDHFGELPVVLNFWAPW